MSKNNYLPGTPLPNGEYTTDESPTAGSVSFKVGLPPNVDKMAEEDIFRVCEYATPVSGGRPLLDVKGSILTLVSNAGGKCSLIRPYGSSNYITATNKHINNVNLDFDRMKPDSVAKLEKAEPTKVPFQEVMFLIKCAKVDAVNNLFEFGARADDVADFKNKLSTLIECYEPMGMGDHLDCITKIKDAVFTVFNEYKNEIADYKAKKEWEQAEELNKQKSKKLAESTIKTKIGAIKNLINDLEI
jgi:hypothetical protein